MVVKMKMARKSTEMISLLLVTELESQERFRSFRPMHFSINYVFDRVGFRNSKFSLCLQDISLNIETEREDSKPILSFYHQVFNMMLSILGPLSRYLWTLTCCRRNLNKLVSIFMSTRHL